MGLLIGRSKSEFERRCRSIQRLMPELASVNIAEIPAAVCASGWICGTPDDVVRHLQALAAVGIDRVMFQHLPVRDLRIAAQQGKARPLRFESHLHSGNPHALLTRISGEAPQTIHITHPGML